MAKRTKRKSTRTPAPPESALRDRAKDEVGETLPSAMLEGVPDETRVAYVQAASFKGPLPPPVLFERYDAVLPGSAERILRLAEKEQAHRQEWEITVLRAQRSDVRRGQWMGFALGMTGMIVAAICATFGLSYVAGASLGTVLVGILTAFLRGRSKDEQQPGQPPD